MAFDRGDRQPRLSGDLGDGQSAFEQFEADFLGVLLWNIKSKHFGSIRTVPCWRTKQPMPSAKPHGASHGGPWRGGIRNPATGKRVHTW